MFSRPLGRLAAAVLSLTAVSAACDDGGDPPADARPDARLSYQVLVETEGLQGAGLTLRSADGESLAISVDGETRFVTPVPDGGSYAVIDPPAGVTRPCSSIDSRLTRSSIA